MLHSKSSYSRRGELRIIPVVHYRQHYVCGYYLLFIMWSRCYQCLTENPVTSQYLQSIYSTVNDQYSHWLSATNYQSSLQFLYNLTT